MNIESDRLLLVPMTVPFLDACLEGHFSLASEILGFDLPPNWPIKRSTFERRKRQLVEDPSFGPWSLRAIVRGDDGAVIGQIGFQSPPGPEYLQEYAPGGVEIGYSILPEFQGRGYASEACRELIAWAHQNYQTELFVLSISPQNGPSLRIAEKFGFGRVGSQWDEEDGEENIFFCRYGLIR
ncbi:N-acetyltransferase [bacterium]|nr:MAG: N-acetyltransferase [bacterium]